MSHTIQPIRRSILCKTQTLLHFLEIQPHSQKPISQFTNLRSPQPSIHPQFRSFCGLLGSKSKLTSDASLDRLLRDEIQYQHDYFIDPEPPAGFNGFKVEERPREQWITLEKKFGKSEDIKIEVTMFDGSAPILEEGLKRGRPDEQYKLHITLIVRIFKEESNQVLEFICSAWPDSLKVRKLFVSGQTKLPVNRPYIGPQFRELDDKLQYSLYEFLKERGIDDKLCVFLHTYIHYKAKVEYIHWIETVKSTVENK